MSTSDPQSELRQLWQTDVGTGTWVDNARAEAMQAFDRSGFPTTRMEDWKYTDTRQLAANYPSWLATTPLAEPTELPLIDIEDSIHLAFVDGRFSPSLSNSKTLPAGVYAGSLADAPELQGRLGKLAGSDNSGFIALNTAFMGDGFVLSVAADQHIERPIYLSFHTVTPRIAVQPRVFIDMGANSEAVVIEHYSGRADAIVNSVTEIRCGAGARLSWDKLQDEHRETLHVATQYAELDANATLQTTQIDIGAGLTRNDLQLRLLGRGAHAEARGLFLADAKRHADSRITVEHVAPDTTSRERYRGILADQASGVFNGSILVQQDAQKTSADLTNRNLLLSAGAEINTKPELEIYADDVKCAHGSTTGQLDETSMFYLLSRGIDPEQARTMLITAFASELLTDIGLPALTESVQDALRQLGQETI